MKRDRDDDIHSQPNLLPFAQGSVDAASQVFSYDPKFVEFIKNDNILEPSAVPAERTMTRKRRPLFQAVLTEMRLSSALKKASATQTVRRTKRLYALPAGATDNSFARKFKERRTKLAERREKNELGEFCP
jgi:hypothetical protein